MGQSEFVNQAVKRIRLFQRIQLLALDIFDQRNARGRLIGQIADYRRDLMKLGHLSRTPTTFPGNDFELIGVVQRVATNTTQPENQMPYYETIIEIPEVRLTKSGIQPEITPGMPLTVDILGDKRTVMNYIITPIEKSWKSAFREQ